MEIFKENGVSIFFGDAQSCPIERTGPEFKDYCTKLVKQLGCSSLVVQDQVHSIAGRYIGFTTEVARPVSDKETRGDFLITDLPGVAVSVLTADCLPIVLVDVCNKVVAAVHAGWKGAVGGITTKVIESMLKKHKFAPDDLRVYFGACAKACCYEVQPEFVHNLIEYQWRDQVLVHRDGKIFFDLSLFNKLHLVDFGIDPRHIHLNFNECTMCNTKYHSNRRNGHSRLCQLTAVWM